MKSRINTSFLLSLSAIYFLGNFGLGLLFPVFSKLLFDPQFALLFVPAIALFPLFQYIGKGAFVFWSKSHSQKTILMWSCFFIGIGFWCSAYFLANTYYLALLFSISFTGFFAGPAAFFRPPLQKSKPLGFMLGILMGAIFSEPFWGAGFIAFFIVLFLGFFLSEHASMSRLKNLPHGGNKGIFLSYGLGLFIFFMTLIFESLLSVLSIQIIYAVPSTASIITLFFVRKV